MILTSVILLLCLTNGYICARIKKGEEIHHSTPIRNEYVILSTLGITLTNGFISFKVKVNSDVHFALISGTTENDQLYEIVIGGWNNTRSVIRTAKQGRPVCSIIGTFLDDGIFKEFWISWNDITIYVGHGLEAASWSIFLEWTNPNGLRPIRNAGIYTAFDSTPGEWIFYKQDLTDAITTQTEKTTDLASPSAIDRTTQMTTIPSCLCPCSKMRKRSHLQSQNLTKEEIVVLLADEIEAIKKELSVAKKSSSKYIRKITSAPDDRNSSKSIGFVAIVVLCVPFALIVMSDIFDLYRFLTRR